MDFKVISYIIYIVVSVCLTVWVAKVLFKNGRVFLIEVFHNNDTLTDAVNKLLLVGFYLINFGYITITLKADTHVASAQEMIEFLSFKIGVIILMLGAMHFFNLLVFFRLRKRSKTEKLISQTSLK